MDPIEIDMLTHQAAATLTAGVLAGVPVPPAAVLDKGLQDPAIQARIYAAWEIHKNFCSWIVNQGRGDPADFPQYKPVHQGPAKPAGGSTTQATPAANPIVQAAGQAAAAVVSKLLPPASGG